MQRWLWPIVLGVTFGVGLVAGVTRPRHTSTEHEIADLQRHIGTLQDELRVRDATVAVLQQQLQATVSTASTPPIASFTPPTPAVQTEPIPHQAQLPPKAAVAPPPKAAVAPPPKAAPAPERTKEAALDLFFQYQQRTEGLEGPARRRQGRVLLDTLLAIGPPAVDALLQVLQDSTSGEERRSAAILLGGLQDPRAIPPLLEIANNDEDILTRRMAARGLSRLQLPEAVPALEAVLATDEDRYVRMNAAYGLARLGKPQGFTELTHIYNEAARDGNGRFSAFQSLVSLDNTHVLPLMHEVAIREPEVGYRLRAIQFMAKNGNQQSLSLLQQIMANPDEQPSIREAAAQAYTALPKAATEKRGDVVR